MKRLDHIFLICVVAGSMALSKGMVCQAAGQAPAPSTSVEKAEGASVDYTRFNHADHGLTNKKRKLVCADCHQLDLKRQAANIRPGAVGHKPCIECHAKQFYVDKPLRICAVCHRTAEYKAKNPADVPYVTTAYRSQFGLAFSHRSHLTPDGHIGGVNREYPFQLNCEFCHPLATGGVKRQTPTHAQCFVCHATPAPAALSVLTAAERNFLPRVIVRMDQCQWCHTSAAMEPKVNLFANRPLTAFRHSAHLEEPDPAHPGEMRRVACESCHKDQRNSPSVFKTRLPEAKE